MTLIKRGFPEELRPKIYYAGVFDYNKLFRTIAAWYADMGYEFQEDVYKHKVPSPLGAEQEWKVAGWRKVNEYVQFWIYIRGYVWELKEIDVVIDGEKQKMCKGKLQLQFYIDVWLDYNNKFKGPMQEKLQAFLNNHVWRKQIESGWEDEVYYRMYKLHLQIKKSLNMSTPTNASQMRY